MEAEEEKDLCSCGIRSRGTVRGGGVAPATSNTLDEEAHCMNRSKKLKNGIKCAPIIYQPQVLQP
jgi:hypothetical protein